MLKLIHLTDTHLVAEGPLYGLDPEHRLLAAIADINANHADAALVLVTGDLAHSGELGAYRRLRAAFNHLNLPWRLMLGNHDNRDAFLTIFDDSPRDEHGFIQEAMKLDGVLLLMLDTLEPDDRGFYCERRISWLSDRLAEAPDVPTYLFMHHPPFEIGLANMDQFGLENPEPVAAVLAKHPQVRHIFFGHVHRPVCGNWRGIAFSSLPALAHQVALDFQARYGVHGLAGHCGDPAYGVVLLDNDRTIVHFHDYMTRNRWFDLMDPETYRDGPKESS
jgi:3',5'-cyclic-AMP phosphodiesterase